MINDEKRSGAYYTGGSLRLVDEPLRTPLENTVSAHKRREWRVRHAQDMSQFACHHCAILSDGSFAVFAKYGEGPDAREQFEIELAGLHYLSENASVLIPAPIAIVAAGNGAMFILEAVRPVERGSLQWRQIGRTLARIHQVTSDTCGFPTNGFVGPLYQDNTPTRDWATFYAERRLWPRLSTAINSGNLPSPVASQVERLIHRLPELCGPNRTQSLLHGDAQQNNFISTERGPVVIDPAVYYGDPEIDMALVDAWEPVPDDVFASYSEEMPLDAGFRERRGLWRVALYLAAVAIEGPMHLCRLRDALRMYV